MNNEKGMVLPMTLGLSFLLFLLFTQHLQFYLDEKQFVKEIEKMDQLENLMQMSIHDITNELSSIEKLDSPIYRSNSYPNGQTQYSVTPDTENIVKVIITCLESGGRQYKVQLFYDLVEKKISKWFEYR